MSNQQSKTPVIFFAFANDRDAHLALLNQESRLLHGTLKELEKLQYIQIYRKENASVEDVFEGFKDHKDAISIFHYAGHANGTQLQLDGGSGKSEGLAQLMGEQPNLKLVFLNGCSTKGQVEGLLDAGVKAVIATSVKINDTMAMKFAEHFYDALANKRTIHQAFNIAEAYLKSKPNSAGKIQQSGGVIRLSRLKSQQDAQMPWALYINPDSEDEVFQWRLPYFRPVGLPQDMIQYIGSSFVANRYIVLILDEMCKYNPDIYHQMVEHRGDEIIKKDSREYPWLVIKNFPWPIGSQIRLLKLFDKPDLDRLKHLVSTYIIAGKLVYDILVSDLWEKSRSFKQPSQMTSLKMNKDTFKLFDYIAAIPDLYEKIKAISEPYMPEVQAVTVAIEDKGSPLSKAHLFLQSMRSKLDTDLSTIDFNKTCLKTEQALSIILRQLTFLSKYKMLTVRNVGVDKQRFSTVSYDIEMGPLNATQGTGLNLYQDDSYRRKTNYTDSLSVVLVSNENKLNQSLNLSPLIIDKNTFVQVKKGTSSSNDKLAHIFLSGWVEEDRLYYIGVEHSFFAALNQDTDQVHTDMTQDDFTEGRNLKESANESFDDDFGMDFGFEAESTVSTGVKVFQTLKDQFELLIADLNQ